MPSKLLMFVLLRSKDWRDWGREMPSKLLMFVPLRFKACRDWGSEMPTKLLMSAPNNARRRRFANLSTPRSEKFFLVSLKENAIPSTSFSAAHSGPVGS